VRATDWCPSLRFALGLTLNVGDRRNRSSEEPDPYWRSPWRHRAAAPGGGGSADLSAGSARISVVSLRSRAAVVGHRAEDVHRRLPAVIRRPLTLVVGLALVLAGLVMLVLPGPGLLIVGLGLAVLALEFSLARRLLAGFWDRLRRGWPPLKLP
jgi:Putative transmembrane protein (PGPGW)